jgi:hypothetical protein
MSGWLCLCPWPVPLQSIAIRLTAYQSLSCTFVPSVALHGVEFTFLGGFEPYRHLVAWETVFFNALSQDPRIVIWTFCIVRISVSERQVGHPIMKRCLQ